MHPHTDWKGPESRGEGHLDFSTNLRDQEAAGSSPATPTRKALDFTKSKAFSLFFVPTRFPLTQV